MSVELTPNPHLGFELNGPQSTPPSFSPRTHKQPREVGVVPIVIPVSLMYKQVQRSEEASQDHTLFRGGAGAQPRSLLPHSLPFSRHKDYGRGFLFPLYPNSMLPHQYMHNLGSSKHETE